MKEQNKQSKKVVTKTEPKSLLEDWPSFRGWQEAFKAQPEGKGSLRQKLDALMEQRKKLQDELDGLWTKQNEESKPLNDKYSKMREEISSEITKLSSEIEILEHAIGEQMAASAPKKSALGDVETFRSYQEALYNARGKRVPA